MLARIIIPCQTDRELPRYTAEFQEKIEFPIKQKHAYGVGRTTQKILRHFQCSAGTHTKKSSRLRSFRNEHLPVLVTQNILLHLAHGIAGQFIQDNQPAGMFESSQ